MISSDCSNYRYKRSNQKSLNEFSLNQLCMVMRCAARKESGASVTLQKKTKVFANRD